jgi:hypothetical protein
MPGYLGLLLPQYLNQVTHADFSTRDKVQQPQPRAVRKGRKQGREIS